MEQGTVSTPNRATFNRCTAKGIWYQTGGSGGVDLGVIDMSSLDEGISREKVMFPIDGNVVLGYDEVVSVAPVYTLKGKQFHTSILPLVYMGSANTAVAQSALSGQTFTIVGIVLGKTYDIGKRNITITGAGVTVGGVTKVADVDYFIETNKGLIRFPNVAAGIANGATVVVNYSQPAITRDSTTAFNQLNQSGNLQLFQMDQLSAIPLEEGTIPGSISRDKSNDGDPTKTNQWSLRFAVTGQPTFLRRQS